LLPIGTKTKALPALLRQQITQYQIRIYKLKHDPAPGIGTKIEADGVNQAMLMGSSALRARCYKPIAQKQKPSSISTEGFSK